MPKKKRGPEPTIWTQDTKKKLAKLYPVLPNSEVAKAFGLDERAIRNAVARFKIKKSNRYWDKSWEDYVLKNWESMSPIEIAESIQKKFKAEKTKWAVINKYRELKGLR